MSLQTPTTKEISDNIIAQLEASLNQSIPLLPKSFLRVLSKALAAVFILLYKYSGFMFLQMFVQTATISDTVINGVTVSPLKQWGRLIGVGDPAPATQAELTIDITVTNQTGFLPSNTQMINSGNGVTYITLGSVLLDAPTVSATVRAASDQTGGSGAGVIGNLDNGAVVSFANPLASVSRNTVVTSQVVTGADGESEDAYRQRIIDRFQKTPQGGAYADYEQWGEEPSGILNAYPYTSACPGQVDVYIESATEPDGIPTNAQLTEALASINQSDRRPANALVNTFPIGRLAFDISVAGLVVDNLGQVQADITTALEQYLEARAPYIEGLSIDPREDRVTVTALGGVVDDVVSAAGGVFAGLALSRDTVNLQIYTLGVGEKAKLGSLSFI
jgi:uncharacterized phage protein gp47/JayE